MLQCLPCFVVKDRVGRSVAANIEYPEIRLSMVIFDFWWHTVPSIIEYIYPKFLIFKQYSILYDWLYHINSNLYGTQVIEDRLWLDPYSILHDLLTIEYRIWDFLVFRIFDIRWCAVHLNSNIYDVCFYIYSIFRDLMLYNIEYGKF